MSSAVAVRLKKTSGTFTFLTPEFQSRARITSDNAENLEMLFSETLILKIPQWGGGGQCYIVAFLPGSLAIYSVVAFPTGEICSLSPHSRIPVFLIVKYVSFVEGKLVFFQNKKR